MSLSYAILGILSYGPMTGYNLKKVFDKSISHVWAASLSQIYRELSKLEHKGYVSSIKEEQKDRPDKRVYTITDDGKNAFVQWLQEFPEELSFSHRDEFMLRIFFGSRLDKEELIKQLKRFILEKSQYLELLEETEKKFNVCPGNFPVESSKKDELFWHLTIKRGKMTLKTLIKWAEECIMELEDVKF
jgi:PadR family transcriptional regulator, regulatory protein AphA